MKSMKRSIYLVSLAALIALLCVPAGCGKDDPVSLSSGGTIEINMSELSVSAEAGATCPSTFYADIPVTIIAKDALGNPINNTAIYINLTWSPKSVDPSHEFWVLYDNSIPRAVPYQTKTGDFGTKNVVVRLDRGCIAEGYIEVFSATARGQADISVI